MVVYLVFFGLSISNYHKIYLVDTSTDNHEGGIFSLYALVRRYGKTSNPNNIGELQLYLTEL
jgi:K+ transporter